MAIPLNAEWQRLFQQYSDEHQNPINQKLHAVGIPLIVASIPTAATVVGLPLAAGLFGVGWTFQFVGHYFEGHEPSFFEDPRYLLVGPMWWLAKRGVKFEGVGPQESNAS